MLIPSSMKGDSYSYWQDVSVPKLSPPHEDLSCDVCVVGAGIAGLSTALQLVRRGADVIVVDRRGIAGGETSLTSAHLTNCMDDGFSNLKKWHGSVGLRMTFESHGWAIDEIERVSREFLIPCDYQRVDGYLFASGPDDQKFLATELEIAREAGGVSIEMVNSIPGLQLGPALHFSRQAEFHPLKYMNGLTATLQKLGVKIFAPATVKDIAPAQVTLDNGLKIFCTSIVVTTNVPINDRLKIHTKIEPVRTYVIALENKAGSLPNFLMWDTEEPYHYVRTYNDVVNNRQVVLVGGEDHKTGQNQNEPPDLRFEHLRGWAQMKLGLDGEVLNHWSGQVIEPADGLAFIGRNPGDENIYICTGDSGQGLTHGTIAGKVIADLITHEADAWAKLYEPSRKTWSQNYFANNANTAAQYLDWLAPGEVSSEDEIRHGTGAIVREGLKRIAVYRDFDGRIFRLSSVCPHLQGSVHWNDTEKTWDCPCHGSRFDRFGHLLNGPAISDLEPAQAESRLRDRRSETDATTPPPSRL